MGILIWLAIAVSILFFYIYQSETSTNTLRDLLAAGKWEKANEETQRLISVATHRAMGKHMETRPLQRDEYNYIPYSIVSAIDQLWVKYSNGHFGFSVQLDILEECKKNDRKKQEIMSNKNQRQEYARLYSWAKDYAKEGLVFDSSDELGEAVELVIFWEKVGWTVSHQSVDSGDYMYDLRDFSGFKYGLDYSMRAPKGHLPFFYNRGSTNIWYCFAMPFLRQFKSIIGKL